ncbi:MAG: serine/threonine-protein phosphatase [Planctomycetes bacterium]|nr:serine/threonine-protein phosphatase [Planctomycetota bacterium]
MKLAEAWTETPAANLSTVRLGELNPDHIQELDGVVMVVDAATKHSHCLVPLAVLEEMHVPVLALVHGSLKPSNIFEHASAMVVDRCTVGAAVCLRLSGLLHRQREVNHLCREIAPAERSQGRLRAEITKIHEDLHLAAIVQRDFLPRELPSLHGVTLAALWRPAHHVSGDIYDVMLLDDDHLGIFLADTVGHGASAALMTMVVCQSLTTRVLEGSTWRILSPADVLTQLNAEMIRRQRKATRFATAVYCVINCRSRVMALAGAGHPPPLFIRADGRCEELETSGGLLGVFSEETYDQVELELEVGDDLLLYTDGFELAFPHADSDAYQQRLPTTRYRREFEKLGGLGSPQEMIETINRQLDIQQGSLHQVDDLTLISLHAGALVPAERRRTAKTVVYV